MNIIKRHKPRFLTADEKRLAFNAKIRKYYKNRKFACPVCREVYSLSSKSTHIKNAKHKRNTLRNTEGTEEQKTYRKFFTTNTNKL